MSSRRSDGGGAGFLTAWSRTLPDSRTTWVRRARRVGFIGTTLLLLWEVRIIPVGDLPTASTLFRLAMVLLLYGVVRWPQAVALASLPILVGEYLAGFQELSATILVPMIVAAVLIATRPRYRGYLYVVTAIVLITAVQPTEQPLEDLVGWSVVYLIPCAFGEGARYALHSIERIRHASEAQLRQQRREVARELHDTSIHDITSLIMALERAKIRGIEDPVLLAEIDHATAMARQSVVSMRGVLNLLRADGARPGHSGGTDRSTGTVRKALDDARDSLERAGHAARVLAEDDVEGALPYSVQVALVRVIQECVVNMVKYARPGTPCTIMVERTTTDTRALFINEFDAVRQPDAALSSGLGLTGIRERVAVVGGTLSVQQQDHRWMVRVAIPTIASTSEGQNNRALQQ